MNILAIILSRFLTTYSTYLNTIAVCPVKIRSYDNPALVRNACYSHCKLGCFRQRPGQHLHGDFDYLCRLSNGGVLTFLDLTCMQKVNTILFWFRCCVDEDCGSGDFFSQSLLKNEQNIGENKTEKAIQSFFLKYRIHKIWYFM